MILYTGRPSLGVSLFLRGRIFSEVLGNSLKMSKTPPGPPPRQGLPLLLVVSAKTVTPPGGGLVRSLTVELLLHAFLTPFTFLSLFLAGQSRRGAQGRRRKKKEKKKRRRKRKKEKIKAAASGGRRSSRSLEEEQKAGEGPCQASGGKKLKSSRFGMFLTFPGRQKCRK